MSKCNREREEDTGRFADSSWSNARKWTYRFSASVDDTLFLFLFFLPFLSLLSVAPASEPYSFNLRGDSRAKAR